MLPTKFYALALTTLVIFLNEGFSASISDESLEMERMAGARSITRPRAIISDTVHQNWGFWGDWVYCEPNEYVLVARVKVQASQGNTTDDTALNGIGLACGSRVEHYFISSSEGKYGAWGSIGGCAAPQWMVGFAINVEPYQGSCLLTGYNGCDDTATNAFKVICGTWVNGEVKNKKDVTLKGPMVWGKWQQDKYCPPNTYVCGIQTQIDLDGGTQANSTAGDRDQTGLNGVALACC